MSYVKTSIDVNQCKCERCGHEWTSKLIERKPKFCPKCRSPYWNKEIVRKSVSENRKK